MRKCCVDIACSHCSSCFNKAIKKKNIFWNINIFLIFLPPQFTFFFLHHSSPTPHLVTYILKTEGKTMLAVSSQTCSSRLVYERSQLLLNPTEALYPGWLFAHDPPFGQMAVTERTFRDLAELMSSIMTAQDGFRLIAGSFIKGTAGFKVDAFLRGCTSKLAAFPLSDSSRTVTAL